MSFTQKDLTRTDGMKNMAGIVKKAYYCLASDIQTFPYVPAEITTLDTAAVITGDIVCKTGKKFNEIYITTGKGSVDSNMVGARDSKSFSNTVKGFFPGTKADALGAAAAFANADLVFIVPEAGQGGAMRVVGSPMHPAEINESSISTGVGADGEKGWTFDFVAPDEIPAPIYEGVLPLTPAV